MTFNFQIISPQQIIFNDEVDLCILPGVEGDFGVLRNHMPFLTSLRIGVAYIFKNKKIVEKFLVNGGIVEVSKNKCTLLSEDVMKNSDYNIQKSDDKIEVKKIKVSKKLYYS
tara:strand:- start:351 stop:686 length:336 start_codon:yes stop_codon:yes gene_type:complete